MVVLHEIKYEAAEKCPPELRAYAIKRNRMSVACWTVAVLGTCAAFVGVAMVGMPVAFSIGVIASFLIIYANIIYKYAVRLYCLKRNKFGWKPASVEEIGYLNIKKVGSMRVPVVEGEVAYSEDDNFIKRGEKVYLFYVATSKLSDEYARFLLKRKD